MNLFKTKFFVFAILILMWSCDNQFLSKQFTDAPAFVGETWYQNSASFLLEMKTNEGESQTVGNLFSVGAGELTVINSDTTILNYLFYNPNTGAIFISNHPFGDEPDPSYILLFTVNSDTASLLIEENGNTLEYYNFDADTKFDFEPTTLTFSADSLSLFSETEEVLIFGNISVSKTTIINGGIPTSVFWIEESILTPTIEHKLAFALEDMIVRYSIEETETDYDTTTFTGNWVFDGDSIITVNESHSNNESFENIYSVIWNQSNTLTVNFPFEVGEALIDLEFIFGLQSGTLVSAVGSVDLLFSHLQPLARPISDFFIHGNCNICLEKTKRGVTN